MSNDNQPITKKDFLNGLMEFFEKVTVPYIEEHIEKRLDEHDKRFDEIDKKLEEHDRRFDKLDDRLNHHGKQLENHEEKIAKLEKISPVTL